MKSRLTLFVILLSVAIISVSIARSNQYHDRLQPILLSRLPYETGPVKHASHNSWDEYWNVQINSDTTTQIQNEEQLAINPLATNNLVAVWRDFRYGYRRCGYGISSDHGLTWTDHVYPAYLYPWQSDPGITFNRDGHFFTVLLTFDPDPDGEDGLIIVESDDNGLTWHDPVIVVDSVAGRFEDKELMACDRTIGPSSGNLYVSWTPFWGESPFYDSTHIMIACSYDSGQSFQEPVIISDDTGVQWSVPAVGAFGEVYVAWVDYYPGAIKMDRSFNYGQTWGVDTEVQPVEFVAGNINGNLYTFSFPAMDVDIFDTPWQGRIYMAYADYREGGSDLDIYMTMSDDHGYNWSTPVPINDMLTYPYVDQFHPWTCVDTNGVVTVVFYDRRWDSNNLLMDLYFTQSTDGGVTWSPNERITTVSSDPTAGSRAGLIGEYVGLVSWDGVPYAAWTDTRNGNQDVFAAALDSTITAVPISKNRLPIPSNISLDAFPNPFNPVAMIRFKLQKADHVTLAIYDITGRRVATLLHTWQSAGTHQRIWNAQGVPSGIYFARLTTRNAALTHKLLLVK